jgi:hypothetical protein
MSMDMQEQVARIQRMQEETRKFVAEAHKRAAEAREPAAEIRKTGWPNGLLGLQIVLAGAFAGGALAAATIVLIKFLRP